MIQIDKLPAKNIIADFFLNNLPRFLFFTGKGGVGKTSLSCATAVMLADNGKNTLLVSTDPASNLGQVLKTEINSHTTPVNGINRLWAINIDPRQSAEKYRERVVGPYRGVLPNAAVAEIEEQLSGACTVEIAAFDEFSRLMTDTSLLSKFDHIIFDTAPTGHTLRLLNLPAAWKGYLESSSGNTSCLGPMSGLDGNKQQFEATLKALMDERTTRLALVARPDKHSIAEAHRTGKELTVLGVTNQQWVINGVLEQDDNQDEVSLAMRRREKNALENIPADLRKLPQIKIGLSPIPPIGIPALRVIFQKQILSSEPISDNCNETIAANAWTLPELINDLNLSSGIIMIMGKGGVGKTTLASILAAEMANKGARVHLTTSDPAAHLDFSLADTHPNLRVSRINPQTEIELYRKEVMQQAGAQLDDEGRRLLEEDLRSPCTEEIAVFRAFAKIVEEARDSLVVLDTAPTGHTLLLLDATEAYHREVSRNRSSIPDEVKNLLPRLRDTSYTKVLLTTLPEATPVQEAVDLQKDLKRAGIFPYAWIINQSLTPLTVSNPVLRARQKNEGVYIRKVQDIASRIVIVPWQATCGKH